MRYALLIYGVSGAAAPGALAEERPAEAGGPSGDGVFDDWVAYTRALKRAGVLVGAERLQVADTATSVRLRAGERLLTDGPYIETKEHLLGFYLVDVADLDAAIDGAAQMQHIRRGSVGGWPGSRAWSTSWSTRGMWPVAGSSLSGWSCATRRSGWGGCCTGWCRRTPRPPGCSR